MAQVQIDHQTPGDTKRVTIFGSSREAVMAAKGQVEQIVTTDDAAAGGVAHSVECPQVSLHSLRMLGHNTSLESYVGRLM